MRIQLWNIVFLIGFIVYIAIRGVFERRTRTNERTLRRLDTVEKTLLIFVGTGSLLLPVIYLFTPWLAFADYRLPPFAPWCGTAIMVAALWLFWRAHADLGQNWSITLELRKDCSCKTGWPAGRLWRRLRSCILFARLGKSK